MKKFISFLLLSTVCMASFAADENSICKINTLSMLVLQKSKNGTVSTVDTTKKTFAVDFGYDLFAGTKSFEVTEIKGATTCNEIHVKSALDGSSSNAGDAAPGDANTFLAAAQEDQGVYCWCKMEGSVTSWWVYLKTYDTASACETDCTSYCANGFANNTPMSNDVGVRSALFNAIW